MNDGLAGIVSQSFEAIVCGCVLAVSTLIALMGVAWPPASLDSIHVDSTTASLSSGVIVTLMVLLAYPLGVFAESASRLAFEWKLDLITRNPTYGFTTEFGQTTEVIRENREKQRVAVMAGNPRIQATVDSQLRRLRLERVLTMCWSLVCVGAVGSLIRDVNIWSWVTLVLTVAIWVLMYKLLVHRFERYCDSIKRAYDDESMADR